MVREGRPEADHSATHQGWKGETSSSAHGTGDPAEVDLGEEGQPVGPPQPLGQWLWGVAVCRRASGGGARGRGGGGAGVYILHSKLNGLAVKNKNKIK